jgi:hypothetical protein
MNFNLSRTHVCDCTIACHDVLLLSLKSTVLIQYPAFAIPELALTFLTAAECTSHTKWG